MDFAENYKILLETEKQKNKKPAHSVIGHFEMNESDLIYFLKTRGINEFYFTKYNRVLGEKYTSIGAYEKMDFALDAFYNDELKWKKVGTLAIQQVKNRI